MMHFTGAGNRVLLLQGPMGSFFSRFGRFLESHGAEVWKVNFNGGDWLFSLGQKKINYRGTREAWSDFLQHVLKTHRINRIFLFGDCRLYHRDAIKVARELGIRVFVFEEGYVRPNYITLEEHGVNGFSSLPRDPSFYLDQPSIVRELKELPANTSFFRMALSAAIYYWAGTFFRPFFRHYAHHKSFSPIKKGSLWCRSIVRKMLYQRPDKVFSERLRQDLSKRYFLAVLQVYNDSQVKYHSPYEDVRDFVSEVIRSFASNAPKDALLVLKHHPMDRGIRHYGKLIRALSSQFGIADRVIYTHQIHLPTALDHARGVVLINSTVGLSALFHGTPVKVLGDAIYDMQGLTCQHPLQDFWKNPGEISQELFAAFRKYLIATTQLNGSFFGLDPFPINKGYAQAKRTWPVMQWIDGAAANFSQSNSSPVVQLPKISAQSPDTDKVIEAGALAVRERAERKVLNRSREMEKM